MIFVHSKTSDGNMSFKYGSTSEVSQNRISFFQKLGIKAESIVELKQIHSRKVILAEQAAKPNTQADGIITNKTGIYLMLKFGDCIPIAFYDPKHKIIGLIHASLRSLEKGIVKSVINKMKKTFHVDPVSLVVKFGPSIGPCCYKTDLWKQAEIQLVSCGILEANIDNPKICTYENKDYFSHRKAQDTKSLEARFVTILGL